MLYSFARLAMRSSGASNRSMVTLAVPCTNDIDYMKSHLQTSACLETIWNKFEIKIKPEERGAFFIKMAAYRIHNEYYNEKHYHVSCAEFYKKYKNDIARHEFDTAFKIVSAHYQQDQSSFNKSLFDSLMREHPDMVQSQTVSEPKTDQKTIDELEAELRNINLATTQERRMQLR